MKKILIAGANSYIGTSFEKFMTQFGDDYRMETLDMRRKDWQLTDFTQYDTLILLAAIVHLNKAPDQLYYEVNRDLAQQVAVKAKESGIKQFIFFSSMSVFGLDIGEISPKTPLVPKTHYGKSKLAAEELLHNLETPEFKVVILRPPIIYGPSCVGNYRRLAELAQNTLFFPKINNQRSMLYINNLHFFLKELIDYQMSGTFHPQNTEYVNTAQLVASIAQVHGRKVRLVPGFQSVLKVAGGVVPMIDKVFGSLTYSPSMPGAPGSIYQTHVLTYARTDFITSIKETEV